MKTKLKQSQQVSHDLPPIETDHSGLGSALKRQLLLDIAQATTFLDRCGAVERAMNQGIPIAELRAFLDTLG